MVTMPNLLRCAMLVALLSGLCFAPLFAKDAKEPKESKATKFKELKNLIDEGDEDDDPKSAYGTRIETPLIGDYTTFAGLTPIRVDGVGLVVGLKGTGGNPAPSQYRTALLEDLKRRNVRGPNEILRSPDTALVFLRAMLPPLMEKGETVDVQVWIPESAEATSLEGGWLMETYLSEQAFVPGKGPLSGHHYLKAKGPILLATAGTAKDKSPALLARGSLLGGGTVLRERELSIYLRNDFKGYRNVTRVAEAISRRFHDFDKYGSQQPMAVAKNDQRITLMVHPKYKNNFPRYLQVIRNLAFREQSTARRLRMQQLKDDLLVAERSEKAALQLEGIGKDTVPILKSALVSPQMECRFHAASALAYLGEADGVAVLAETVKSEPAFRVFALAALSVIDDAEAHLALRGLMNEASMETRYGSFRSLWVLDKNDPFIRGEQIKVLEGKTGYMLHEVDTRGEPLVHLTTRTRPEVVLFGTEQKLSAPLYLSAGKNIMVTAQAGAQRASIRKFTLDQPDEQREVPLDVASVVRAVSELDATYPDVVQMLMEAADQNNLPGRLTHDALPEAGRVYQRPVISADGAIKAKTTRKTRIGLETQTPNLFAPDPGKDQKSPEKEESPEAESGVMANVAKESMNAGGSPSDDKPTDEPKSKEMKDSSPRKSATAKKPAGDDTSADPRLPRWLTPRVRKFTSDESSEAKPKPTPPEKRSRTSVEGLGGQSEPE